MFLIDNFKNLLSPQYSGDLIYFLVIFILLWKITKEDMLHNIIPNKNIIFGLIFGIVTIGWLPQLKPIVLIGMLLGFYWSFIALLALSILLFLYTIIMIVNKGKQQAFSEVYPLAPFWFLGSVFAVIFGNIINSYLGITLITG